MKSPLSPLAAIDQTDLTRVVVTRGVDLGLCQELRARTFYIGTAPDNEIVLSDPTVSPRHCQVTASEQKLRVRDADSKLGVQATDCWIRDATFEGEVALSLGKTRLTITALVPPLRDGSLTLAAKSSSDASDELRALLRLMARWNAEHGSVLASAELDPEASSRVLTTLASNPTTTSITPLRVARRRAADEFERDYLKLVLARTAGNLSRAAAIAEVSRQMMQRMARKHGFQGGRGAGGGS